MVIFVLHIASVFITSYSKYSWSKPLQSCVFVKLLTTDPKMKLSSEVFTFLKQFMLVLTYLLW